MEQLREACSERDLIADLIISLDKYGIDLISITPATVRMPTKISEGDSGFASRKNVSLDFQRNGRRFGRICARYKDKVKSRWVDGCYDYFGYTDEK